MLYFIFVCVYRHTRMSKGADVDGLVWKKRERERSFHYRSETSLGLCSCFRSNPSQIKRKCRLKNLVDESGFNLFFSLSN